MHKDGQNGRQNHVAAIEVAALDRVIEGIQSGLAILRQGGDVSLQRLMDELEHQEIDLQVRANKARSRWNQNRDTVEPWEN